MQSERSQKCSRRTVNRFCEFTCTCGKDYLTTFCFKGFATSIQKLSLTNTCNFSVYDSWRIPGAYAGWVHWVHVHPPPLTWEKSSAQKCPKEARKFRPDMSAKKNVHVPLRYDKIKTKKLKEKEENSKRKGLKLKK